MKFPDNRANVFVVMRVPTSQTSKDKGVPIGVFASYEEANNYAVSSAQELMERVGYDVYFCKVELTTFYG